MQTLKADTQVVVMLGPAVDKTDGVTLESGLVAAMDTTTTGIRISKNGAAWADRAATVVTTVYDEGWYRVTLKTGDVDTEGTLDVMYEDATTCLPLFARFQVVNANVYDSLFAAATTDYLQVDTLQLGGATQSATDLKDFADAGYDPATNKVQGVVLTDTVTTNTDLVTAAAVVNEWETQSQADPTGFHVNVIEIGGTTQTANDNGADINEILVDTNSTLNTHLTDIKGATFSGATDALDAIRAEGDSNWGAGAVTSDSGTAQAGAASPGTITLANTASAANDTYNGHLVYIESGAGAGQARAIKDYNGTSKVADTVTDWAVAPDNTSVYKVFPDEITEITAAPTANTVAAAVWDLGHSGHTDPNTFGEQAVTDVNAILSKVTTLESDWADGGRLDLIQDIIAADTTTDIPALIATAQSDLDTLTGTDGATLATTQANYAPAKAGDNMGTVSSVTGNVDGNVGGNVTGSVGSVTGHTAQTGDSFALANGATGFAAIDTVVDAIKVKTDGLNFTGTEVDANVEQINATTVLGVGTSGDKWRA